MIYAQAPESLIAALRAALHIPAEVGVAIEPLGDDLVFRLDAPSAFAGLRRRHMFPALRLHEIRDLHPVQASRKVFDRLRHGLARLLECACDPSDPRGCGATCVNRRSDRCVTPTT